MKLFGPTTIAITASLTALAFPLWADTLSCAPHGISVNYHERSHAMLICEATEQAIALFDQCNVPSLPDKLHIDIVEDLQPGCVGQFHCGQDKIEVLPPEVMEERRDPDGPLRFLPTEEYFQSVVIHELAHAANDEMPCRFEACPVTAEYIAYAMQIMSLKRDARLALFRKSKADRPVSRYELSYMLLLMAPNLFATKVAGHLSQLDDPCAFIGQITAGDIVLDRERF